jgi:hypothetical protein
MHGKPLKILTVEHMFLLELSLLHTEASLNLLSEKRKINMQKSHDAVYYRAICLV